nr:vegetative cell wall protein gp1-like [Aegilops tauschii subsp. strangulata]
MPCAAASALRRGSPDPSAGASPGTHPSPPTAPLQIPRHPRSSSAPPEPRPPAAAGMLQPRRRLPGVRHRPPPSCRAGAPHLSLRVPAAFASSADGRRHLGFRAAAPEQRRPAPLPPSSGELTPASFSMPDPDPQFPPLPPHATGQIPFVAGHVPPLPWPTIAHHVTPPPSSTARRRKGPPSPSPARPSPSGPGRARAPPPFAVLRHRSPDVPAAVPCAAASALRRRSSDPAAGASPGTHPSPPTAPLQIPRRPSPVRPPPPACSSPATVCREFAALHRRLAAPERRTSPSASPPPSPPPPTIAVTSASAPPRRNRAGPRLCHCPPRREER